MRAGITDLVRAKDEFGPRALLAIAEECAPFEHLRCRAVRDRIITADIHTKAAAIGRQIAERMGAS